MTANPSQSARNNAASWPTAAQFNEAVQNLATRMADEELRGGTAAVNAFGLPLLYSGGFADVYRVHCPATGNTWAVKFFKHAVSGQRERYRAISDCLEQARLRFMVDFSYLENGVRIAGAWYPIVKMRWVEGHGNRILFLDETEQNAFQDVGGEAGAVAFAP
jgi:hypothetical protein